MTQHVDDLIATYVLGALSDDERIRVEEHLRECERCRTEAAELAAVAGLLPLSLDPMSPPPALKQRILAAAAQDLASHATVESALERPAVPWYRRWFPLTRLGLAAAVVITLVVGIAIGRVVWTQTPSTQQRYHQLLGQFVAHGDEVVPFQPTQANIRGEAALVVTPSGSALVVVGHISPPPPGKVYQVWFMTTPAAPTSAGILARLPSQPKVVRLRIDARGYKLAAVTIEPGPTGSPHPTSPPLMQASLSRA
jgi:anti-sigma-K factor RskA